MSNPGPSVTQSTNLSPLTGTFDANGKLITAYGPGGVAQTQIATYATDPLTGVNSLLGPDGRRVVAAGPNQGLVPVSATNAVNFTSLPYGIVSNYSKISLRRTRIALAAAAVNIRNQSGTGGGSFSMLCVGDSTVRGWHSGTPDGTNYTKNSWPSYLAAELTARGYGASSNGAFTDGSTGLATGGDTALAIGAGITNTINNTLSGANGWNIPASNVNSITYTPSGNVDSLDVYYSGYTTTALGTFTADNGGAAFLTQATGSKASNAIYKASATFTSSSNPINIKWSAGNAVWISGMQAYLSTATPIQVINAGANGSTSADWTGAGVYQFLNSLANVAPKLVICSLGFNDMGTLTAAQYQANLTTLAAAVMAANIDMIFVVQHPQAVSVKTIAIQQTYWQAVLTVASTYGIPIVDIPDLVGTAETAASIYYDTTHLNGSGNALIAKAVADVILNS